MEKKIFQDGIILKTYRSRELWLKNRKGIGGSDIAAVIGESHHMSNTDLWEIKTGRKVQKDISKLPYVKYGTDAEKHLRQLFRLDYPDLKVFYKPNNSIVNERYPFAQVSLDGWIQDKDGRLGVWECKTTTITSRSDWDEWEGCIPQHYYCQLTYCMAVIGAEFGILRVHMRYMDKDGGMRSQIRDYSVERSEAEDDIRYILEKAGEFWRYVAEDRRPPLRL